MERDGDSKGGKPTKGVKAKANDGLGQRRFERPRGSGARGVEWADVDDKYRRLVPASGLPTSRVEASLEVVHGFDRLKAMRELTGLLQVAP